MALGEEYVATGNWLFRWRSYLPLIMIGLVFLGLRDYQIPGHSESLDHFWELFALGVSLVGLLIRA